MAKKDGKGRLSHIVIRLHHAGSGGQDIATTGDRDMSGGGLNDGFEIEHHFQSDPQSGGTEFLEPRNMGVTNSHADVMDHIHRHIKGHGSDGEQQDELSGGRQEQGAHGAQEAREHETGCVYCDSGASDKFSEEMGEHEVQESHLSNLSRHGYHKGTAADPHTSHSGKHPGFKAVQSKIAAKEHLSRKAAGAILASRTRGASKAAHHANPRLNRVKG